MNTALMLVKFRVSGNLRFLSHAETVRVFQRACMRAGIKMQYSHGFNPHPKMSLPLPRTVGVESDDDLLCLKLRHDQLSNAKVLSADIKARLADQLPDGCEVLSVDVANAGKPPQPYLAVYVLPLRKSGLPEIRKKLAARIERLLQSKSLCVERILHPHKDRTAAAGKNVDVRPFLKSIEMDSKGIMVECKISGAGSIRVDEILKLLELEPEQLAATVRRTGVQFRRA